MKPEDQVKDGGKVAVCGMYTAAQPASNEGYPAWRISELRADIEFCTRTIANLTALRSRHEQELAQLQGVAPLTTVREPFPVRALRDWVK